MGKTCLVIDKRKHLGGNIYCENVDGINVHKYGPHIFHTNDKYIWDYVNQFAEFNNYINSPVSLSKGKLYNLPFNMNTFYQLWGTKTPEEAKVIIDNQVKKYGCKNPKNLEEQALSLIGKDVYETLIKEYTDKYQGIPIGGYNKIITGLLTGIDTKVNIDYFNNKEKLTNLANKIVFTGKIDEFYNYQYGSLEYRSLRFENKRLEKVNHQGNAVMNFNDSDIPYTRIIEHKHFEFGKQKHTIITKEFSEKWTKEKEAYYPINNDENQKIYQKYKELSIKDSNIIFGGRLAEYKYYDMHQIVASALSKVKLEFS